MCVRDGSDVLVNCRVHLERKEIKEQQEMRVTLDQQDPRDP